jgi:hypothetical protein
MKSSIACLVLLMVVPLVAQQAPAAPQPPRPAATQKPPQPPAPPQPAPSPQTTTTPAADVGIVDQESPGQPVNIRLDVSVVDQISPAPVQPKTLMVILADRAATRIRSAFEDRQINVDGRAVLVDGRIRVTVTVASRDPVQGQRGSNNTVNPLWWEHVFSLLLENGKPMVALETFDTANKRRLAIEVKATILK